MNETRHNTEMHPAEHIVPVRAYIMVYLALMALLVATVGVAFINLGPFSLAIAMVIAVVKAVLIVLIFMHVYYTHDRVVWIFAGMGAVWLFIMFHLLLSDYLFRGWIGVPGK